MNWTKAFPPLLLLAVAGLFAASSSCSSPEADEPGQDEDDSPPDDGDSPTSGGGSTSSTPSDVERVCEAGRVQTCPCPGGTESTQECIEGGWKWGPCDCPDASGGSGAFPLGAVGGSSGMVGVGGGTALPTAGGSGGIPGAGGMVSAGGSGGLVAAGGMVNAGGSGGMVAAGGSGGALGAGGTASGGVPAAGGASAGAVGAGGTAGVATGAGGSSAGAPAAGAGAGGVTAAGGTAGAPVATGGATTTIVGESGLIPSDEGNFIKDWADSGVIGAWYVYTDTGGSTIASTYPDPNGYSDIGSVDGQLCFSGTAVGHEDTLQATNWGAGVGFDVCGYPDSLTGLPTDVTEGVTAGTSYTATACPTGLGSVSSITFTVTGTVGAEMRIIFSADANDVEPFFIIDAAGTYTVAATDALVPADWDVTNAGEAGSPTAVKKIQFQVASQTADTAFDFCISEVTIT